MIHPLPLSEKAIESLKANGWLTVWEGAIRSGKTVASSIAWVIYVLSCPADTFIMSGRTVGSLSRNVLNGDFGILSMFGSLARMARDNAGSLCLMIGRKRCYMFGANDVGAHMSLRGITAAGWYADEVSTHHKDFIVEAFSRTVVSPHRRCFWTLNPMSPKHYIYQDFLDVYDERQLPGYNWFHFSIHDNPAMTAERIEEVSQQYVGRFYDRYVLGLRTQSDGVIYSMLNESHVFEGFVKPHGSATYVSVDYGTQNPCVFLQGFYHQGIYHIEKEWRWDARKQRKQMTDSQYADAMVAMTGGSRFVNTVIVDPSASSFIAELSARNFYVKLATNDVLPGIRKLMNLIARDRVRICKDCSGLLDELALYSWDSAACDRGEERPNKVNDHGPDALRYFVTTVKY